MKAIQYTIRNVPPKVDRFLRERARLSKKSLNEVVLAELSSSTTQGKGSVIESLDWFIGSNTVDKASLRAIEAAKKEQKALVAKEMGFDTRHKRL